MRGGSSARSAWAGDQLVAEIAGLDVEPHLGESIRDAEGVANHDYLRHIRPFPGDVPFLRRCRALPVRREHREHNDLELPDPVERIAAPDRQHPIRSGIGIRPFDARLDASGDYLYVADAAIASVSGFGERRLPDGVRVVSDGGCSRARRPSG
ncbi:MAG: hypothetical protein ABI595_13365 [Actinomycetota bacterium]